MSDLREQVMRALVLASYRSQEPDKPSGGIILGKQQKECWQAVADECIRQMEWARFQVMVELADEANQPIDFTKGHTDAVCPLTPAPDDWKPE